MDMFTLILKKLKMKLRTENRYVRCGMAEFLGTLILILFGCGSVAQMELSGYAKAQFLSVNMAFGFAVTAGAYVCAGVSGAHLNPAVSLSMCLLQRMTCRMMLVYFLAQFLGAFIGAALVFALYFDAIHVYSGGNLTVSGAQATAGIFASYPSEHLSVLNGLTDQVIATAALMVSILAVIDEGTMRPAGSAAICDRPRRSPGWPVDGLQLWLPDKSCQGPGTPTLHCHGWLGPGVFRAGNDWWWVPVLGPMIGGVLGTLTYELLVGIHNCAPHEDDPKEDADGNPPGSMSWFSLMLNMEDLITSLKVSERQNFCPRSQKFLPPSTAFC